MPFLLQGIFPSQGSNCVLILEVDSIPPSHLGSTLQMVSPPVLSSEVSVLHRSCLTHHPDGPSSLPSRSGPWTPGLRDPPVSSGSRGSCTWPPAGGVYMSPTFLAAWQPAGWNQSLPLESNSLLTLYSSRCGEAGGADMSPNQIRVDPQHCKLALPSWRVTV